MARKPSCAKMRALAASQAFGSRSIGGCGCHCRSCSASACRVSCVCRDCGVPLLISGSCLHGVASAPSFSLAWLVGSRRRAEADGEAVPAIDGDDGECQVGQLIFAELLTRLFVYVVGDVRLGNQRHRLRPCQGGAFAVSIEWRLTPGAQRVEALLRLTTGAGVLGVHIQTEGAAVD